MKLRFTVHHQPEIFSSLEKEWIALLPNSFTDHVFLTPQFQFVWWQTLGRGELNLVTARDEDGRLVAILPMLLETNSQNQTVLNLVGCEAVSDYLDWIVDQSVARTLAQQISAFLKSDMSFDHVDFCSLRTDSFLYQYGLKIFAQWHNGPDFIPTDVCPQFQLPQSYEEYLMHVVNRKQRHEIRRKWRKAQQESRLQFIQLKGAQINKKAVANFIRLHQLSSDNKAKFWNEAHLSFFEQVLPKLAQLDWVTIFNLNLGDETIASIVVFTYEHHFQLYNSGFNPEYLDLSPGWIIIAESIQNAIQENFTTYDFLRGNEQYKYRLGGQDMPLFALRVS